MAEHTINSLTSSLSRCLFCNVHNGQKIAKVAQMTQFRPFEPIEDFGSNFLQDFDATQIQVLKFLKIHQLAILAFFVATLAIFLELTLGFVVFVEVLDLMHDVLRAKNWNPRNLVIRLHVYFSWRISFPSFQ